MKKTTIALIILTLIAGLFISCSQEMTVDADVHNKIIDIDTFCINGKYFSTLQAAVDYFKDSKAMKAVGDNDNVIYLTKNASGPGADIADVKDLTIDFAGFTYSFTDVTAKQGETGGKFGLSITDGSEVTLKGLEQIDLFDSTADLTMVYIEGSDTSLTIEDAPKMVVEPTQYVFWAANGATLTIGSTDATKEAAITGKIAATGGTTEESEPSIKVKAKTTITGSIEATKANVTLSGKTVVNGTVSATESMVEANETSKVTGKIEASASKVSVSGAAKIEVDLTAKDNSEVVINTVETGAEPSVIKTMDKEETSTVVVAGGSVNVEEVAKGSDKTIEVADDATVSGGDVEEKQITTYVAKINGKTVYGTMEEAIEAASTTGHRDEIILLRTATENIEIPKNRNVIINLKSYGLGEEGSNISVTVKGSVTVRAEAGGTVYGEMHLKSGSDTVLESGEYIIDNPLTAVEEGAKFTITGGTYNFPPPDLFVPKYCEVTGTGPTWTVVKRAKDDEDTVAEISGRYYKDLQAALDESINGDTVVLLKESYSDESVVIPEKLSITLDLNGNTIKGNVGDDVGRFAVVNKGTLIVEDTSSAKTGHIYNLYQNSQAHGALLNTEGASLTVNGGDFGSEDTRGAAVQNEGGFVVLNSGTYTSISQTDSQGNYSTARGWAYAINNIYGDMTINGGSVTMRSDGILHGGIGINGGTVVVNNIDLNSFEGKLAYNSIYIGQLDNRDISVTVNDGSFRGSEINSVGIVRCYNSKDVSIEITGGMFNAKNGGIYIDSAPSVSPSTNKITITGGTYNENPSAYVAEGYYAKPQGTEPETWIVIPDTPQVSVVKNGESKGVTMSLASFRDKVNAGNTYEGYTITLLDDVDLKNVAWTPIGNNTNPFSGVFDGKNHTISNIKVDISSKDAGLFGVVRGQDSPDTFKRYLNEVWDDSNYSIRPNSDSESNFKTVIKNIRLSEVDVSTTDAYAGALAGYTIDTYISNIVVSSGKVHADKGKVGGITGSSNGCSVLNELETGSGLTVSSKKHSIGGIVGSVQRKYDNSDDHQTVIRTNTDHAIIIENCTNNATVNWPEGGMYDQGVPIAGIVGHCGSISEQLVVIIYKCTNNGAITADKCSYASGIVGQTGVQVKKIYGCVNNGKVTADASYSGGVGGVAGIGITGGGDVIKCSNTGTLTNNCTGAGGYVFSITSSGTSIKITGDSFDSVDGLKTAIDNQYHPGITSVALKNVTVKDTEGSLSLPSTIESISSDTKVCNEVNLTASASLATINMVGLNQVVNCERSLSFGGENNIITVPENTTIGDITLNGTNNTFINNGTMNILSYGRTGFFTVTNNGLMKGLSNCTGNNSDANMNFTNNGTVERNDGYTIHIECGGYLRINNYGTIARGGSGVYAMLLYLSCNVDIYAYGGSIVTGKFAPYSEAHQVHVFYKEGTTIDGKSWTTVASEQYHVTVEQF